jgi:hypothetical protein
VEVNYDRPDDETEPSSAFGPVEELRNRTDAVVTFASYDRPEAVADVEVAVFEGEAVLFDVHASMVHHLNAVPAATWLCCDGKTTVAELIDELVDTFSVSAPGDIDMLTTAVHESLARFASEGLLVGRPQATRVTMEPVPQRAGDGTEIFVAHDNP